MKFIIRRAVFAVITMPVAFVAYGVIYFGLGLLTATNTASVPAYLENLWAIGFAWVICIAFAKQILDWTERLTRP
jgi:hypothetical protein